MTTISAVPARPRAGDTARLLALSTAFGTVLGVGDLVLQTTLPYPLANLANSSAVWALAAFALAAALRSTPGRGALAGTTLLVVAVEAYYVAAVLVDRADLESLVRPSTVAWAASGVVAGVVFGIAGSWVGQDAPWRSAAGLAAAASVFLAEAGVRLMPGSGLGLGDAPTVLLTSALGVAVLLAAVGRPAHLARAAVLVGPMTVLGTLAFAVVR